MSELEYNFLPVTDFRSRAKETLDELHEHPVILTQRGRPSAILVDYESYRTLVNRIDELELTVDSLLLDRARDTAEEFISLEDLFQGYEAATQSKIPPGEG